MQSRIDWNEKKKQFYSKFEERTWNNEPKMWSDEFTTRKIRRAWPMIGFILLFVSVQLTVGSCCRPEINEELFARKKTSIKSRNISLRIDAKISLKKHWYISDKLMVIIGMDGIDGI